MADKPTEHGMTGPEHYREAADFLADATNAAPDAEPVHVALLLEFAKVHATLAQTAATVEGADLTMRDDWFRAVRGGAS